MDDDADCAGHEWVLLDVAFEARGAERGYGCKWCPAVMYVPSQAENRPPLG